MMRAVYVGCGNMSGVWLNALTNIPSLSKQVEVVAVVDVDPSRADAAADRFWPTALRMTDVSEAIAKTNPDIVFDVVVPEARGAVVKAAFAAGCHVLSEKPLGLSLNEARRLLKVGREAGVVHAVLQNRRYLHGIRRAKALIDAGAIGDVTEVHCDYFMDTDFGGFRAVMDNVLLIDMAIHTFDMARYVSGCEPERVFCHESNPKGSNYRTGASASAIFRCKNNIVLTYRGSWAAKGMETEWEANWRITGTKGTIIWDGIDRFDVEVLDESENDERYKRIDVPNVTAPDMLTGHAGVIADFLEACHSGTPPLTAAADNIHSLEMVFGAIESARLGHVVKLGQLGESA